MDIKIYGGIISSGITIQVAFQIEKNDDEILKKLQIKTAEKTASDAVVQQNTPQNEQFANQMMLQLLPKLIENPDSFSKLIKLADKAKK